MLFEGHNAYITVCYAVTALVFATAILWVVLDGRAQREQLAKLQNKNIDEIGR